MSENSGDQSPPTPESSSGPADSGSSSSSGSGSGSGSSTGLDTTIAGLLCYLLGFLTGIVFLLIEKEDQDDRFHAMQSTLTFGGIFLANVALTFIPFIGWLISLLLIPVSLILWIVLMIKAFQGGRFKLPIVGDIAEQRI